MTVLTGRFQRSRWCAERIKLDAMNVGDIESFPMNKLDLVRLTIYRLEYAYEVRKYTRQRMGEHYVVTRLDDIELKST